MSTSAFATEHGGERERHAMVIDLSEHGLRLQRPVLGMSRLGCGLIQLEFEIPEVDEIVWASGAVCFDEVRRTGPVGTNGLRAAMRTSGVRVLNTAERHRRLLREYVNDSYRAELLRGEHAPANEWMMRASCYLRG